MEKFYSLSEGQKKGAVVLSANKDLYDFKLIRGEIKPKNLKLRIHKGSKFFDFLYLHDAPLNHVVSDFFIQQLRDNALTGWQTYDVSIIGNKEKTYFGFQISGKAGKHSKPKKTGFYKGLRFDIKSWDGSDFFIPGDTAFVLCTERAKNALEEACTNIYFEDIKNMELYHDEDDD